MILSEVLTAITDIVPYGSSREATIRRKINAIIRLISMSGEFWPDIDETTIGAADGVDSASYIQAIPITSAVRRLIYVQYPEENTPLIKLHNISELVQRRNCSHMNSVAYLSAATLHIKHTELTSTFNVGYYTHPAFFATDGTDDGETNWILEKFPDLIVDMTCAYLLNLYGDNEDSKRVSDMASMFKTSFILDTVRSVVQ